MELFIIWFALGTIILCLSKKKNKKIKTRRNCFIRFSTKSIVWCSEAKWLNEFCYFIDLRHYHSCRLRNRTKRKRRRLKIRVQVKPILCSLTMRHFIVLSHVHDHKCWIVFQSQKVFDEITIYSLAYMRFQSIFLVFIIKLWQKVEDEKLHRKKWFMWFAILAILLFVS